MSLGRWSGVFVGLAAAYVVGLTGLSLLTVNPGFRDEYHRPRLVDLPSAGFVAKGDQLRQRAARASLILPAAPRPAVIALWRGERRGPVMVRLAGRPIGVFRPGGKFRLRFRVPAGRRVIRFEALGPRPDLTLTRLVISNVVGYSSGFPSIYLTPGPAPVTGPRGRGWWWLVLLGTAVVGLHVLVNRFRPIGVRALPAAAAWTLIPLAAIFLVWLGLRLAGFGLVWPLSTLLLAAALPAVIGLLFGLRHSPLADWLASPREGVWPAGGPAWWRRHGRLIVVGWALAGALVAGDSVRDLATKNASLGPTERYPGFGVTRLLPEIDRRLGRSEPVGFVAAPGRSLFRPQVGLAQVRFALSPRVVTSPAFEEPAWGGGPRPVIVVGPGREIVAEFLSRAGPWPASLLGVFGRLQTDLIPRWVIVAGPDRAAVRPVLHRNRLRLVLFRDGWGLAERR
ncbi:MAG: hypothetical protein KJ621_06105 [Proteobacteria bacterium]|nr:hypothetical protein [Pseudomonadota bacterium]